VPANLRGEIGRRGEELAARRLERLGYEVVARNHRTRAGEIDLIARRGGTLVFCEVKALVARRGGRGVGPAFPLEAVGPAKRAQVRQLARSWLAERDESDRAARRFRELRFDAIGVLVTPAGELLHLEHVEAAF
jgi:putative endonuclease